MAAPRGNKYAAGCNTSGRPMKYTPEVKKKEFKDLLEWSKKPTSFNLLDYTYDKDYTLSMLGEWARENDEYSRAYRKAKERLGQNIRKQLTDKKNPYNQSAYHREIGNYDCDLNAYERAEKIFEANLKKASSENEELTSVLNLIKDEIIKANNPIKE
jgi:tetratricopeptide (TPR) repeat protein